MKFDGAREITNQVIGLLEEGPGAWKRTWRTLAEVGKPHNGMSGRHYQGLNIWLLAACGYQDPRWYTFDQAKEAVGYKRNPDWKGRADTYKGVAKWIWPGPGDDPKLGVRKGEKSRMIFFWRFLDKWMDVSTGKAVRNPSKEQVVSGSVVKVGSVPIIRTYRVFNATQIDGLNPWNGVPQVDPAKKYHAAQDLVDSMGIDIRHGGDRPRYWPKRDYIEVPEPGQFNTIEDYWVTLFTQIAHWTGHPTRLNRALGKRFGRDAVAMEEMVSELTAAFLCAHLGIGTGTDPQHAAYINRWIKVLRDDKYAVFTAASAAQKSTDFIINGGQKASEAA